MTDPQETARQLDRADPLQDFREQFFIPKREDGSDQLYFCGHSLGLQPKSAAATLDEDAFGGSSATVSVDASTLTVRERRREFVGEEMPPAAIELEGEVTPDPRRKLLLPMSPPKLGARPPMFHVLRRPFVLAPCGPVPATCPAPSSWCGRAECIWIPSSEEIF